MEDISESPAKKRKIEETSGEKAENDHVAENEENSNPALKTKPVLQIKTATLARLRQAAKNCQILSSPTKNSVKDKDNGPSATMATGESRDKNQNEDKKECVDTDNKGSKEEVVTSSGEGNDVIISSTGSSPAHSPKPEDLTILSTPPKQSKPSQNKSIETSAVLKNLNDRFEDPSGPSKQQGNVKDVGKEKGSPAISSMDENKSQSTKKDTDVEMIVIDEKEGEKSEVIEETGTAEATAEKPKIDFNSFELKKVLRAMIDEKFKQVEELYQTQGPESELYKRIARLEDENRGLQEYAAKLEKAVKLLLNNQRMKKEQQSQIVQTDEAVLFRAKPAPTKTISSPTSQAQSQLNYVNKPGNSAVVTSKLTSTQAPIPGHSFRPDSFTQQRMSYPPQPTRAPVAISPSQGPTGQTMSGPPYQAQRPPQSQYVQNIRPNVPQGSSALPRRATPVTVTVHPQTSPQPNTGNMILSPAYPQVQKSTYPPVRPTQAVPQPQQLPPNPGNLQSAGGPPLVVRHQVNHSPVSQTGPVVASRPPPPQQVLSSQMAPQGLQQYPNPAGMRSPPTARTGVQSIPPTSLHHIGPVANNSLATSPRPVQNANSTFQTNKQHIPQSLTAVSPRDQGMVRHVDAQNVSQSVANYHSRDQPPRPIVSIAVVSNGIVLSWNMQNMQSSPRIVRYQLFALQDMGANNPPSQWKKIGVVNALPLPMACTLTQFMPGNKYHFTVRAQDEQGRCGPHSDPCTITLT